MVPTNFKHHLLSVCSIIFLCILIYSNSLNSPFAFDDSPNIENNPYIRISELDFQKISDAGFKSISYNRPLANISFALNYYFGKYDVTGFHVVNIIIHIINGILVYFFSLITIKQTSNIPDQNFPHVRSASIQVMSLFAALIFIAHPVQTQSVTYIVQRMNSMAAMFFLLALILYINGRLSRIKWKRWALFLGCFLSWVMSLGCKETAGMLPFIILLYEWYFFQDLRLGWLKQNIKYFIGLFVVLIILVLIYLGKSPFDKILSSYAHRDFTMFERVLTQFRVVVFYISLLLFPHPSRLNLLHHVTISHSFLNPATTLLSLLVIFGLGFLAILIARKQRLISFFILWFFINLIIESSVIGLEMVFEHRLYLPILGFILIVASMIFHLLKKQAWAITLAVIMILFLGSATYVRNKVWQDSVTLWSDVVSKNPKSYRAYHNMGVVLKEQGRHKEAIDYFSRALSIKPEFAEVHNNLGFALMEQGRLKEAIDYFTEALKIQPDFAQAHNNLGTAFISQGRIKEATDHFSEAIKLKSDYAEAHNNMGNSLQEQGKLKEAIQFFSNALRIKPDFAGAHNNMGTALAHQGRFKEAIGHFSKALKIQPDFSEAHNSLGTTLARQGRVKEAISHFSQAIRLKPDYAKAHYNLGTALASQNKLQEAISYFSEALRIKSDFPGAHNSLGAVLARLGRCKEAIGHFSEAIRLKPDYARAHNNLKLCQRKMKTSMQILNGLEKP